ncbi:peptide-methionine (S)-S-oxide reductase MsrA [Psychroflexus planctonicus]|uniref:Peptide methionine sulfoxide reductase MsrA n=1 Tax=Psychroflexus planctonicus TaxID=1526575 RepID=A0ABQ1SJF8_9FLAO|nr:peptide-methionine (S)-S-oxide reductase MsrA [Psychroflexus planctonicus]GGE42435.1 peptide methionine sulfoxide reductase MsrA [Psychroflexus planctonicus]
MALSEAILANGCFWCTEAVFLQLQGVKEVHSGFTGGTIKNPPYREVVMGRTGHAEAIQIFFDEDVISYEQILYVFFATHDPTTLNKQGYDVGTQYRSAIFYKNDTQKQIAENVITSIESENVYHNPIVTEVTPASPFYKAEEEHQDFYQRNTEFRYCQLIIEPKLSTLRKKFQHLLIKNS